jgi:hypothetical protein
VYKGVTKIWPPDAPPASDFGVTLFHLQLGTDPSSLPAIAPGTLQAPLLVNNANAGTYGVRFSPGVWGYNVADVLTSATIYKTPFFWRPILPMKITVDMKYIGRGNGHGETFNLQRIAVGQTSFISPEIFYHDLWHNVSYPLKLEFYVPNKSIVPDTDYGEIHTFECFVYGNLDLGFKRDGDMILDHYYPDDTRQNYSNFINWIVVGGRNHDSCNYELKEMKIEAGGFEIEE